MKRLTIISAAISLLLIGLTVAAQQQPPRRPAPMMTNDDVVSPGASRSVEAGSINRTNSSGSPLTNARGVLESALSKMGEVNSVRTRLLASTPAGQRELLIESVKP